MGTGPQDARVELVLRLIAVAGALIGAAWGLQWIVRMRAPFDVEDVLQLMFSFLMTVMFALRAAGKNTERRRWVNAAVLSAIWVVRCSFKDYSLGVATFSTLAALAVVGFIIATWQLRAAQ